MNFFHTRFRRIIENVIKNVIGMAYHFRDRPGHAGGRSIGAVLNNYVKELCN